MVWMADLRRGTSYHQLTNNAHWTVCGRYIGPLVEGTRHQHGHVLPIVRAVDDYAAKPCEQCPSAQEAA